MEGWKEDRIDSCVRGENPTLITRMKSGFAVMGDNQFLPGYCVLLGYPQAGALNELPLAGRMQYLLDMTLLGDAILQACRPLRVNYSTLMNLDPYLHTHVEARYEWEPEEYRTRPSCFYPKEERYQEQYEYSDARFGELKREIKRALESRMDAAY